MRRYRTRGGIEAKFLSFIVPIHMHLCRRKIDSRSWEVVDGSSEPRAAWMHLRLNNLNFPQWIDPV